MDLNKAMVGLYKQRGDSVRMRKQNSKKQEPQNSPAKNVIEPPENLVQEKKKFKEDDMLSELYRKPTKTFDMLHGCNEAIEELKEIIDLFRNEQTKPDWPVYICAGKGLGKTSLIEATADYADLKFQVIPFRTISDQSRNEMRVTLGLMTKHCQMNQPAIVLLDDIDCIHEKEELRPTLNKAIDALMKDDLKLIVFCTGSLELDSELQFSHTIYLRRPDTQSRLKILMNLIKQSDKSTEVNDETLSTLAMNTPSFSAVDLQKMIYLSRIKSQGKNAKIRYELAINIVKRSLKRGTHLIGERPSITWDQIGGLPDVRRAFSDILRNIKTGNINCKFAGIILYGPPGCGKTMVAQAMANEAGLNFIAINGPELFDKFLGETEKNIRKVFREAKEHEPCMIYFDEFDGLCKKRGDRDNVTNAIQTLLSEMDGFTNRGKSIILASTNRLHDIDLAIRRPGRLSNHIEVGLPDKSARLEILKKVTKSFKLSSDIDLVDWANDKTKDFSGAHLSYLVEQARLEATRNITLEDMNDNSDLILLTRVHFDKALEAITKTLESSKE